MKDSDKKDNYWRDGAEPLSENSEYHDIGSGAGDEPGAPEVNPVSASEHENRTEEQAGDADGNPTTPPDEPVVSDGAEEKAPPRTKPRKKWGGYAAAALLAAALAFGAGYAGVQLGYRNTGGGGVTIGSAYNGTETPAAPTGAGALTSEQVAEKTVPSVVAITTEQMTTSNFWFGSRIASGAGSGVILTADGYIVTNYHVVGGADTIKVTLSDGTEYDAAIVGTQREGDLAVIKINAKNLTPATFADSDKVKQGAAVYAVGNPEGTLSDSITAGIVSALSRTITTGADDGGRTNPFSGSGQSKNVVRLNVLQFDAAVSPGNSGGGLFDVRGELIGIVCAKSSDAESEGLSFALIGNNVRKTAEDLIANGSGPEEPEEPQTGEELPASENKAVLGIVAAQLDENTARQYGYSSAGVYIARITLDSASKAGLAEGDRIISVDNVQVGETKDVTSYLADKAPGDKVKVTIERSGKTQTVEVTLQKNGDAA